MIYIVSVACACNMIKLPLVLVFLWHSIIWHDIQGQWGKKKVYRLMVLTALGWSEFPAVWNLIWNYLYYRSRKRLHSNNKYVRLGNMILMNVEEVAPWCNTIVIFRTYWRNKNASTAFFVVLQLLVEITSCFFQELFFKLNEFG